MPHFEHAVTESLEPEARADVKTDPERIAWALGLGLWIIVLLGAIGYVLHGLPTALLGGLLGLFLASYCYHRGRFESVRRALGAAPPPDRGDTIDWRRLLDYEKFHFAHQLEREGHEEKAEAIYQHLVTHEFPGLAPYRRLAAIYRRRGAHRAEIDMLEQALSYLSDTAENESIRTSSTRQELLRQRDQARERLNTS